jgi:hypothetical protein
MNEHNLPQINTTALELKEHQKLTLTNYAVFIEPFKDRCSMFYEAGESIINDSFIAAVTLPIPPMLQLVPEEFENPENPDEPIIVTHAWGPEDKKNRERVIKENDYSHKCRQRHEDTLWIYISDNISAEVKTRLNRDGGEWPDTKKKKDTLRFFRLARDACASHICSTISSPTQKLQVLTQKDAVFGGSFDLFMQQFQRLQEMLITANSSITDQEYTKYLCDGLDYAQFTGCPEYSLVFPNKAGDMNFPKLDFAAFLSAINKWYNARQKHADAQSAGSGQQQQPHLQQGQGQVSRAYVAQQLQPPVSQQRPQQQQLQQQYQQPPAQQYHPAAADR